MAKITDSKKDYGQIFVNDRATLIREITTMLPFTTISLLGPSGTGKTSIIEDLINVKELAIDEIKIVRLQGVSSEDFRIPFIKTYTKQIKEEKEEIDPFTGEKSTKYELKEVEDKKVELVNMGVFQEILDNPKKRYLVFFDKHFVA